MNNNGSVFLNPLVVLDLEDEAQDGTSSREALLRPCVKVILLDNPLLRGGSVRQD